MMDSLLPSLTHLKVHTEDKENKYEPPEKLVKARVKNVDIGLRALLNDVRDLFGDDFAGPLFTYFKMSNVASNPAYEALAVNWPHIRPAGTLVLAKPEPNNRDESWPEQGWPCLIVDPVQYMMLNGNTRSADKGSTRIPNNKVVVLFLGELTFAYVSTNYIFRYQQLPPIPPTGSYNRAKYMTAMQEAINYDRPMTSRIDQTHTRYFMWPRDTSHQGVAVYYAVRHYDSADIRPPNIFASSVGTGIQTFPPNTWNRMYWIGTPPPLLGPNPQQDPWGGGGGDGGEGDEGQKRRRGGGDWMPKMTDSQHEAMKQLLKRRKTMMDKRAERSRQEAKAAQEEADAAQEEADAAEEILELFKKDGDSDWDGDTY